MSICYIGHLKESRERLHIVESWQMIDNFAQLIDNSRQVTDNSARLIDKFPI